MTYDLTFSNDAKESIAKFKKSNPKAYKKLTNLLYELQEHPKNGTGHPEALRNYDSCIYSREITKKDRLVYEINETSITVLILSVEGHYNDK